MVSAALDSRSSGVGRTLAGAVQIVFLGKGLYSYSG